MKSESRVQDDLADFTSDGQEPLNRGRRTHLAFFHEASCARCLGLETVNGIRGCSGWPDSFVSPWERGGLALEYAK